MQVSKEVLQSKYYLLGIFILIILFSYYRVNLKRDSLYKGKETDFELTVIDKKYKNDQYIVIFQGKEKLISYIKDFPYNVGDIIKVNGNLLKPSNNTMPNTFNYKMYLQSRGILWELKVRMTNIIDKNHSLINKMKKFITDRIDKFKYNEYLYVFLLGDTSFFKNETRNIYQTCGLSYLLSIGAFQILIIVKLLEKMMGRVRLNKKCSLIIKIIFILGYILLTNKIIGVLRSGLCYILSSILKYYKIKYKYQNIIFIIGSILLLINPYYLINIGFLYSFAVSIIISINNKLNNDSYFMRLLKISIIAFIASLPITIYSNYEINFLAIIFSFIFVPIYHFIIFPLSILVFIFSFLSPIYYFIISSLELIISILSKIDIFLFIFKKPSMIMIIIYYLVIVYTIFNKKNIIILIILLFIHANINKIIRDKQITFLDVGQGDSILIKNNNLLYLIDTGGNIYNNQSDNILKYIKSLGISEIKTIIFSHGEFDHMGNSIDIIKKYRVGRVIFNCDEYSKLENEVIELLNNKNIEYYSCIKELSFSNEKLQFLNTGLYDNENDNSNVVYTEINGYKFFFMGDASKKKEIDIMNKYNISNIDVLKVGHHGSKTSSSKEFINKIKPKYSIISVGKNNRYGHPNREVLDNLEDSKVYRTDQNGSVVFNIKKNKLKIKTYEPY